MGSVTAKCGGIGDLVAGEFPARDATMVVSSHLPAFRSNPTPPG
jgi:hypothetical protein